MSSTEAKFKRTVVLITGHARAGKDTFADGIVEGAKHHVLRLNFADTLKQRCDDFLASLKIGGRDSNNSFYNEDFKIKNRAALVEMAILARSIDKDVFAKAFCEQCQWHEENMANVGENCTVVCSDWRYENEHLVVGLLLGIFGWDVYTVLISTMGVLPACEEELKSIGAIKRECPIDLELLFAPDSKRTILAEGKHFAQTIGI